MLATANIFKVIYSLLIVDAQCYVAGKHTAMILVIITACGSLLLLGIVIVLTIIFCLCCKKYVPKSKWIVLDQ